MHLQDAMRHERIDGVERFVGEDASGRFALWAGHEHFMTSLVFGLARYRCAGQPWQYLALPRALVHMREGELHLTTRRWLRDQDHRRISTVLDQRLREEEAGLAQVRSSLRRMEEEMLRRLWSLERDALR